MWIFGGSNRNNQQPDLAQLGLANPGAGGAGGSSEPPPQLTNAEKKAMEAYRFDSSALERAAQAARELERSSKFFFN